jgi:hypothetical protein
MLPGQENVGNRPLPLDRQRSPGLGCLPKGLPGAHELPAASVEFPAQLSDKSEKGLGVVAEDSGVAGPPELASQQSLGLVALGAGSLRRLLGRSDPWLVAFAPLLGGAGAPTPILGQSLGPPGRSACPDRFRSGRLRLRTDGFGTSQFRRSPRRVGTLALRVTRPFSWSPPGRHGFRHGGREYPDATKYATARAVSSATCKSV